MKNENFLKLTHIINDRAMPNFGIADFCSLKNRLIPCRAKSRIPENSKSVIMFAFPYLQRRESGNISSYAKVCDYHPIVLSMLKDLSLSLKGTFEGNNFEVFCDNSPIPEVYTASICSLGVVGKNGLLITADYGSFVFLGEIVTDLELPATKSEIQSCIGCSICEKRCPGKAISNGRIIKENCVSDISQKKKELTSSEESLLIKADTVWGCDICQNCCPMNKNIKPTFLKPFKENIKKDISLEEVLEDDFEEKNSDRAFLWRGKKVLERNLRIINKAHGNNNDN